MLITADVSAPLPKWSPPWLSSKGAWAVDVPISQCHLSCVADPGICNDSFSLWAQNLQTQTWEPCGWAETRGFLGGFHVGISRLQIFQGAQTGVSSLAPLFSASPRDQHWMSFWLHLETSPRLPSDWWDQMFSQASILRTMDQDFADLKLMYAHDMILSNPWRIHLVPGAAVVINFRSAMKGVMDSCLMSDLVSRTLHSVSALFACMFIASVRRASGYAQFELVPVRCQLVRWDSQAEPTLVVQDEVYYLDSRNGGTHTLTQKYCHRNIYYMQTAVGAIL